MVLLTVLSIGALAGCGSVGNGDAASVNGVTLSNDTLRSWLDSPLGGQIQTSTDTKLAVGGFARSAVTWWIQSQVFEAAGLHADTTEFETQAAAQYSEWANAPAEFKQVAAGALSTMRALQAGTLDPGTLTDLVSAAKVQVDPRLGVWNPASFEVVGRT